MAKKLIGSDVAKVYKALQGDDVERSLYWGDAVEVTDETGARIEIAWADKPGGQTQKRYLSKNVVFTDTPPLKVRFIDVGQGDGAIVESPSGKLLLIDGGQERHLLHYVSRAFPKPTPFAGIVVTHGDADHFAGVTTLVNDAGRVTAEHVWHNGLAKRPSAVGETAMFGATTTSQGALYCTDLVDDLATVPDAELNQFFKPWKKALGTLKTAGGQATPCKRLSAGDAFDPFPGENVKFEVLGPIVEKVGGKPALRMLHRSATSSAYSASHTVNGHSIVLRLTFGNVRVLFAADLNEESEALLLSAQPDIEAEVLKVPHHGSHDFSDAMLKAVSPVVSIVSSGDESVDQDHIHPRAILMGALGRASRIDRPVVLVTEMVAFFENLKADEKNAAEAAGIKDAHRLARKREFGIVHMRTDGKRLLIVTRGADAKETEPYAFRVDASHAIQHAPVKRV